MSSLLSSDPDGRISSQSSSPLQGSSPPQIAYINGVNGVSAETNGVHQQDTPNGIIRQQPQQQEVSNGIHQQGTRYPDVLHNFASEPEPVPASDINGDNINGHNVNGNNVNGDQ